ncbi:MAG: DUF1570 domain-containing protein [Verrucomicrobiota bacterium]
MKPGLAALAVFFLPVVSAALGQQIKFIETQEKLTPKERERVTRVMQKALEFHRGHHLFKDTVTLTLTLFEREGEYLDYKYKTTGMQEKSGGFYSPARQELATHRENFRWLQVVIHEAEHHLIYLSQPGCPIWLNEGLAEFFSTGYVRGSRIVFRPRKDWLKEVGKWRRLGHLPPLEDLFAMSHREFMDVTHRTEGSRSYAIAYALVYYLMYNEENRQVLQAVMRDAGQRGIPVEKALDDHYPGGVSRLEHDWYRFLRLPKGNVVF